MQGDTYKSINNYIEKLKSGEVNLLKDEVFNGLMDTFDIINYLNGFPETG